MAFTTDLNHGCTNHHTGTSAAAPLAAAIYALVLEANPNLTWRDIMHITVLGSRSDAIPSNTNVIRNAARFNVSSRFGFGLMDAGLMTWYATGWRNVPPMSTCESTTSYPKRIITARSNQTFSLNLIECKNDIDPRHEVNYIEQVQAFVTLSTDRRGEVEICLYSPSNTKTQLLPRRERDQSNKGFQDWPFLTVQLWGEVPHGQWKLEIRNNGGGSATLISWRLIVHGTREYPISPRSTYIQSAFEPDRSSCHIECKLDQPCGNTDTNCTECRHFKQPLSDGKFRCVGICPEGTYPYEQDKLCLPCHLQCGSCRNASETSCISCKSDLFLIHDLMTCVESCPEQYYTDRHLRKCIRCKTDCASCDISSDKCTSCSDGYALKNTDCIKASEPCESNEYFDFTINQCRWCDSRCLTCSGSQIDQCKSCDKIGKYPYLQYHACVLSCSPGFYLSKSLLQCLPCHETCLNCTSSSELSCTSCKLGYVFLSDNHRCEKHTSKPYYLDVNTGETHTCHGSCTQCKGPKPNDCIACNTINEVLLDDGHCVNKCPLGSYKSEKKTIDFQTNICLQCSIGCISCNNINQCLQCDESKRYKLVDSNCIPTCKQGTFPSNDHCEFCDNQCVTCTNLTHCLTCVDQLVLFNNQCIEECPDGYYLYNQQCFQCHPICSTCNGPSEDNCKTCSPGFERNGNECKSQCANGNYFDKDETKCKICTNNCLECLHPGSYCRQCRYPMALDTLTHRCLFCCTTNITTNNCCQCPSSWDGKKAFKILYTSIEKQFFFNKGFCLHPLVTPSIHINNWLSSSIDVMRNKFNDLDDYYQKFIIIVLVIFFISIILCLIILSLRQIFNSRLTSRQEHANVEYVMLQNVDDHDDDEIKSIETNGHTKKIPPSDTTISITIAEET
ncbi:unnamed protein product [Rotaria sp. Silwood2]|nr:unnamed protein product [Rotaria sp. Silwood2]